MGQNGCIWKVVKKFGAFVEEGGVVLVPFEKKWTSGTHHKAGAEVFGHAADQERGCEGWVPPRGSLIDPCQHAGGCRFAMRSRNHQRFAAGQKLVMQDSCHRAKRDAVV